jgi:hypothetical protein
VLNSKEKFVWYNIVPVKKAHHHLIPKIIFFDYRSCSSFTLCVVPESPRFESVQHVWVNQHADPRVAIPLDQLHHPNTPATARASSTAAGAEASWGVCLPAVVVTLFCW